MTQSPDLPPEIPVVEVPEAALPTSPEPVMERPTLRMRARRVLSALFSAETRTGRLMRPVLRWLAAITGLFALGLLAGYLALYQPVARQKNELAGQLDLTGSTLRTREAALAAATAEREQLKSKLAQTEAELNTARGKNDLMWVLDGVNNARVALVNKDGVAARGALERAQSDLARVMPALQKYDPTAADITRSRLELAIKELVIDPQAALADLNKLHSDLTALVAAMFK